MFRVFFFEFRHSFFRWVFLLLLASGIFLAVINSHPLITVGWDLNWALSSTLSVNTVFAVGFAAWEGLRSRRRGLVASRMAGRSLAFAHALHLLSLWVWTALAWLGTLLVLLIRAWLMGLYGTPEAWALVHVLLVLLFFTTLGFTVALLVGRWWIIPILVAAPLFMSILLERLPFYRYYQLNPLEPFLESAFEVYKPLLYPSLVLIALAATLVLLVIAALRFRLSPVVSGFVGALALAGVVLGTILAVRLGANPRVYLAEGRLPYIRLESKDPNLEIFVMEQYRPVSKELLAAWSRIAGLFQGSELGFHTLRQQGRRNEPVGNLRDFELSPGGLVRDIVSNSFYKSLIGLRGRAGPLPFKNSGQASQYNFAATGDAVFYAWFESAKNPVQGLPEPPGPMADTYKAMKYLYSLDSHKARQWVSSHIEQIKTGWWRREDFGLDGKARILG